MVVRPCLGPAVTGVRCASASDLARWLLPRAYGHARRTTGRGRELKALELRQDLGACGHYGSKASCRIEALLRNRRTVPDAKNWRPIGRGSRKVAMWWHRGMKPRSLEKVSCNGAPIVVFSRWHCANCGCAPRCQGTNGPDDRKEDVWEGVHCGRRARVHAGADTRKPFGGSGSHRSVPIQALSIPDAHAGS